MNPDGEHDYRGHIKPGSFWPIALFLSIVTLAVAAVCVTGLIVAFGR